MHLGKADRGLLCAVPPLGAHSAVVCKCDPALEELTACCQRNHGHYLLQRCSCQIMGQAAVMYARDLGGKASLPVEVAQRSPRGEVRVQKDHNVA